LTRPDGPSYTKLFGLYPSFPMNSDTTLHGTTILAVRVKGSCAIAGDGQVTLGQTVVKHTARKIRRLHNGQVLAGFAGSTADAMALFAKFEAKIEEFRGSLERATVELAKDWRTDRVLRRLEAFLVVADRESSFLISGAGDVIAPDDGLIAVGSGGPFALAAARALARHTDMDAARLALEAMKIAAGICIFTNDSILVESL
jgi:ATP-dependent HslUV protease, peptidase subunit HslV